jgi:MFS transporter, OFA family, oxalate/formate antiporter
METNKQNRWLIAIMCTMLMIVLGTVYAWSFFQKLIVSEFGWSNSGVAWAFSTSIAFIGFAAAWGGINMPKYGPKKLAIIGAVLYGLGYILAALAFKMASLPLLIAGFGVVGGIGLGLGYVTPVVSASKWFPDKQGLVTGMVVMGFGFGALIMSKIIAPAMMGLANQSLISGFLLHRDCSFGSWCDLGILCPVPTC